MRKPGIKGDLTDWQSPMNQHICGALHAASDYVSMQRDAN
jgi:hypothetical protein